MHAGKARVGVLLQEHPVVCEDDDPGAPAPADHPLAGLDGDEGTALEIIIDVHGPQASPAAQRHGACPVVVRCGASGSCGSAESPASAGTSSPVLGGSGIFDRAWRHTCPFLMHR